MNTQVLQELIDGAGKYFLANRRVDGFRNDDTREALLIAPHADRELWNTKIEDLPYKVVAKFAHSELKTTIHLGKTYAPFQYGIRNEELFTIK